MPPRWLRLVPRDRASAARDRRLSGTVEPSFFGDPSGICAGNAPGGFLFVVMVVAHVSNLDDVTAMPGLATSSTAVAGA